jgi:NAD(P)-dependent dehydrogenase (short-subunit alcohol dehydrogenase family)
MAATTKPVVLVTGANRGIGRAAAKALAQDHNYEVVLGCRSLDLGLAAASELRSELHIDDNFRVVQLDLTSDASINVAVSTLKKDFGHLDALVNNAGLLLDNFFNEPDYAYSTRELFDQTFAINVTGTAVLTEKLLPLLRRATHAPPRVVFVTSRLGSLAVATDTTTPFYNSESKAYDASKAAVNMLMLNFNRILKDVGGRVNAVCPGLVSTRLTRFNEYATAPEDGARQVVKMATVGSDGPTGTVSDFQGEVPF